MIGVVDEHAASEELRLMSFERGDTQYVSLLKKTGISY